jgi:protein gp37
MGNITGIAWTKRTWNPWYGCHKISQGCMNCYMYRQAKQYGHAPYKVVRSKTTFKAPLRWAKKATARELVFSCSWSDWFIEEADEWRPEAWGIIRKTPNLTYQLLTKRPERIAGHLPSDWGAGYENVWLGVTVESQQYATRMNIPRAIPAKLRWVSAEPLLGPLKLNLDGYTWIVTGGESDYLAPRPADPQWFRDIRDDCAKAGVAFFHKQNGGSRKCRCHKAWGCSLLDNTIYHQYPA